MQGDTSVLLGVKGLTNLSLLQFFPCRRDTGKFPDLPDEEDGGSLAVEGLLDPLAENTENSLVSVNNGEQNKNSTNKQKKTNKKKNNNNNKLFFMKM